VERIRFASSFSSLCLQRSEKKVFLIATQSGPTATECHGGCFQDMNPRPPT
jgi:hypothetical protein